jgi:phosphoribosylformimino-5-aminoimidazole carboxamide ribotide isomerase
VQIVGVVDLRGGLAVHARGGNREHYRPVRAVAGAAIAPGDARALARAYVGRLGVTEIYLADLDAIDGLAPQDAEITALAANAPRIWLDAGVTSPERARHVLSLGAAHVIVGLETLPSYQALAEICHVADGRVAFSLDLRDGEPVVAADGIVRREPPHVIAARAASAGVGAILVIDLARVGAGKGLDFGLIARVRETASALTLLAGGGVRGPEDLTRLADAGCDGALVASALLDGRVGATEIAAVRELGHRDA